MMQMYANYAYTMYRFTSTFFERTKTILVDNLQNFVTFN